MQRLRGPPRRATGRGHAGEPDGVRRPGAGRRGAASGNSPVGRLAALERQLRRRLGLRRPAPPAIRTAPARCCRRWRRPAAARPRSAEASATCVRTSAAGGGFALSGGPVNAQSTAWAVQGLVAAGVSPARVRRGGRSPLDYLASVQARDGHYRYSGSSDQTPVWVTSPGAASRLAVARSRCRR